MINDFFEYDNSNSILKYSHREKEYRIKISNVKSAILHKDDQIILVVHVLNNTEFLKGFSVIGELLFDQAIPEHYSYWYLSGSKLRIACTEKDEHAEQSGRSGWWFNIDADSGEMIKDCWAY